MKTQDRRPNARALSQGEITVLYHLWKHERQHSSRGCLVSELAAAFDNAGGGPSLQATALARKYANCLANRHPPYIKSEYAPALPPLHSRSLSETEKRKTPVRYRTIPDFFIRWPRTAVFVLRLFVSELDINGNVKKLDFYNSMRQEFGFTDADLQSDLEYTVLAPEPGYPRPQPNYIREYRHDQAIQLMDRIHLEMGYLLLIARHFDHKNVDGLLRNVCARLGYDEMQD
jgi:hypothetical protein